MEGRTRSTIAVALWLAMAGCASPVGTTAHSLLNNVRENPDPNLRHLAYTKLGSSRCYDSDDQKAEAARLLATKLEPGVEPTATRAVICRTLGTLPRPESRAALLKAVDDPEGIVRAEACRALGRVGRWEDATTLARVMSADTLTDCRVAAIDALGALKPSDPRIATALADAMEHRDPAIRHASLQALRSISGKDLGVEAGPWRDHARTLAHHAGAPRG